MVTSCICRSSAIILAVVLMIPVAAQTATTSTPKITAGEVKGEETAIKNWIPQRVTKAKFQTFVLADQNDFKLANNLPDDYFSRRIKAAEPLAASTGELLEKQGVILDQESMKVMLALVSKSSGRLVNEPKDSEKFKAATETLARVVGESVQTAAVSDGAHYITSTDINKALMKLCPVYPICP